MSKFTMLSNGKLTYPVPLAPVHLVNVDHVGMLVNVEHPCHMHILHYMTIIHGQL